jgi:PTH1 family peptidyl-tRNA hydrolase
MKLIVGLGNPGEKYENTRHNLGFMAVDKFMKNFEMVERTVWKKSEKLKSWVVDLDWQPKEGELERVILAKPQTYMNNSGMAVELIASFYKIAAEDIWVVHDELDLPIGAMRIRFGGAAAGHHGVESVIERLGTDKFWRFRLGIGFTHPHSGREGREDGHARLVSKQFVGNVEAHVLSPFGEAEHGKARELIKHGSEAISYALEKGLEKAMNRCNTK